MDEESKLRTQNERGERAKGILESNLVKEAFDKIEEEIDRAWKESRPDDETQRRNAYYTHVAYTRFRSYLEHIVKTGDAAGKQLIEGHKKGWFR